MQIISEVSIFLSCVIWERGSQNKVQILSILTSLEGLFKFCVMF